uniref:OBP47-like domain-containing protein n=1 Tax=Phlebotomus papatasi TaxID=29031 RepID=A0A1B0DN98_PHLPP
MCSIVPSLFAVLSCLAVGIFGQEQDCRQPPPLRINPRECCKQPKLIDDSIFAGCFERFGMNNQNFQSPQRQSFRQAPSQNQRAFRGPPPGFPSTCMAECVFNSVNLSVDQPESAGEFITKALEKKAPEWIPIFTEGFTFCTKTATEKLSANDLAEKFDGCSPLPGAILGCLHSHVFTKCPQNVWKNVPGCDQLKNFFTACSIPPMF